MNQGDINNNREEQEDEEISFEEILANLQLSGEVIITIDPLVEDRVRVGLRNFKAKQILKLREEGLPVSTDEVLEFSSVPSKEHKNYCDLTILLRKKGIVKIKKMVVPDNSY